MTTLCKTTKMVIQRIPVENEELPEEITKTLSQPKRKRSHRRRRRTAKKTQDKSGHSSKGVSRQIMRACVPVILLSFVGGAGGNGDSQGLRQCPGQNYNGTHVDDGWIDNYSMKVVPMNDICSLHDRHLFEAYQHIKEDSAMDAVTEEEACPVQEKKSVDVGLSSQYCDIGETANVSITSDFFSGETSHGVMHALSILDANIMNSTIEMFGMSYLVNDDSKADENTHQCFLGDFADNNHMTASKWRGQKMTDIQYEVCEATNQGNNQKTSTNVTGTATAQAEAEKHLKQELQKIVRELGTFISDVGTLDTCTKSRIKVDCPDARIEIDLRIRCDEISSMDRPPDGTVNKGKGSEKPPETNQIEMFGVICLLTFICLYGLEHVNTSLHEDAEPGSSGQQLEADTQGENDTTENRFQQPSPRLENVDIVDCIHDDNLPLKDIHGLDFNVHGNLGLVAELGEMDVLEEEGMLPEEA